MTSQKGIKLLGFREEPAAPGTKPKVSGYNSILEIADNIFPPLAHLSLQLVRSPQRRPHDLPSDQARAGAALATPPPPKPCAVPAQAA